MAIGFFIFALFFSSISSISVTGNVDQSLAPFRAKKQENEGNRPKRFVQLEENEDMIASRYKLCDLPDGRRGQCRLPNSCTISDFGGDFLKITQYLCVYNSEKGTIGVCCPQAELDESINGLAGDLPQTAFANEDPETLLRVTSGVTRTRGCGVNTGSRTRLVGARPANPHEWPWMAAILEQRKGQFCGGTLITDRHVLTAAHCTYKRFVERLTVRLGEYDFQRSNDSRSTDFKVAEKREHVDYQHQTYRHDISVLKLERRVIFNTYVWPVCLPPVGRSFVNQTAVVIGWGTMFFGGPPSDVLMEVSVPMWPHDTCQKAFTDVIYDTVLCAGGYDGGHDSCQGDSGGPLMYQMESGRWTLVGIVSWGVRCGEPGKPGVYTDVQKYLRWIVENTRF